MLDDLPRRGRTARPLGRAVDRAWTFDDRDRFDLRWWPQGVATGEHAGRRFAAISWYAKKLPWDPATQGSRLTFLDLDTLRYRHVLLVLATADGVEPLRVHAGGIAWHRGLLYVAATGKGFHVCRLDDVLRVPAPGLVESFGYRYLLPTWRRYRTTSDGDLAPLRFSFLSIGPGSDPGSGPGSDPGSGRHERVPGSALLAGEYASATQGGTHRLARYPLDPMTGLPLAGDDGRVPAQQVGEGVVSMQGVALARGRHHVTTSHGRLRRGTVWTGAPGDLRAHRGATPVGPEDLSYDATTDELWTVTEHPGARWVVSMRRTWFD